MNWRFRFGGTSLRVRTVNVRRNHFGATLLGTRITRPSEQGSRSRCVNVGSRRLSMNQKVGLAVPGEPRNGATDPGRTFSGEGLKRRFVGALGQTRPTNARFIVPMRVKMNRRLSMNRGADILSAGSSGILPHESRGKDAPRTGRLGSPPHASRLMNREQVRKEHEAFDQDRAVPLPAGKNVSPFCLLRVMNRSYANTHHAPHPHWHHLHDTAP